MITQKKNHTSMHGTKKDNSQRKKLNGQTTTNQNNKISIFPFYIRKSLFKKKKSPTVWIKRHTHSLLVKVKDFHSKMFITQPFLKTNF